MTEVNLDPEDWESFQDLGTKMLVEMMTHLKTIRDKPVWQPIPDSVRSTYREPLNEEPQHLSDVYQEFRDNILPYALGNIHPRFWGWVIGTGTPVGVLAEMLKAGMNPNLGGGDHSANYIEMQVVEWMKEIFGFPRDASGILTTGGSMANLVGLTVARNKKTGHDVRNQGIYTTRPPVVYGSVETHSSVQKAIELLGIGKEFYHTIPVNDRFEIDLQSLTQTIETDKEAGLRPICIVGNAGTVNTGAFDNLPELAQIARQENAWFHVDGAFGAFACLSSSHKDLVHGINQADSLAFDLHKWMYMPYDIGCILVRSEADHYKTFTLTPDYLAHETRGIPSGKKWLSDYDFLLSRGFRGLKAWMSLKTHGLKQYKLLIQQNIDQAQYLTDKVKSNLNLRLIAPTSLNTVCFQFVPHDKGLPIEEVNQMNREIVLQLHEKGIAAPSYASLNGLYAIRVCITNHRSIRPDLDLFIQSVIEIGQNLTSV
ncbi:MAG: pyridoxal phosphate-dependent decarboxylase family protein [Candidatus Heimdallarchaeota archaeon]